ncbi:NADPH:quinone reductase [Streptomyces fodineus]|uniref:NADPH:quinone reductase n=1 Tax=Streptomyces fodineus TaxID=1904616 RepID=A0A1D7YF63_9ACTN|nr:NADPH:quinone reductase [Streptomyces fodineus]AOR34263.1 NADPH:quinone reductase [Streptomyces fodineus]
MKAIVYSSVGDCDVLEFVEREVPEPAPGEVRVKVLISGVNPTDWKARQFGHAGGALMFPEVIPHHDGSGVIDAVGPGVDPSRVGQRVWIWEAGWRRAHGTAAEYVVLPARQAVPLPESVSFEVGASLGLRTIAAHRCLMAVQNGPDRLGPGALEGRTVLVAGGAGAVGHAAIQLGNWCGATVIATVSGEEKAELARAAGAAHTVDYRSGKAAEEIRGVAPGGVDLIVEVAASANVATDLDVLAPNGTVAAYGTEMDARLTLPIPPVIGRNLRYQFVLALTLPPADKDLAVADVAAAVAAGALDVGEEAGLPLRRFPLWRTGEAQDAVRSGVVGKVLVDIG